MDSVRVDKAKLLEILRENRNRHRQIFEEALEGYRKLVIEELERNLEDARAGRKIARSIKLIEPSDHTSEYDAVIDMLEMSLDDEIEIPAHMFREYVRDEWGWSRNFLASNAEYSATAASFLAGSS